MKRREFTTKAAIGVLAAPVLSSVQAKERLFNLNNAEVKVPLGLDGHAVRGMKWKDEQVIEYAAELKMDCVLLNSLNYFKSLEDKYLKSLKKQLDKKDLSMYIGIGSLSVNSTTYSPNSGTPGELIETGIRMAKILNSPTVNCKIGNYKDRLTDGGIVARMEELIKELSAKKSQIQDANLKFAVENHAGDMRSEEVLTVIKEVGTDVCGAMLDPGNSVWTMENPMMQIEKLGKYAVCSSIRDYRVWESENGATFQWTAIGEGSMDFRKYTKRMSELCPGVPLNIETISDKQEEIPYLKEDFWTAYPDLKASGMRDFFEMLRNGKEIPLPKAPAGEDDKLFAQRHQKEELKKSIDYLRNKCEAVNKV